MRVLVGIVIAVFLGLLTWLWGPQIGHGLVKLAFEGSAALIILVALVLLLTVAFVLEGALRGVAITALLAVVVLGGFTAVRFGYDVKTVYAAGTKVVTSEVPSFAERAPYDVAQASSTTNLGDTTGEVLGVKMVADAGDHGLWTALVLRRGFMAGYEAVQSNDVPLYGAADAKTVTTCDFNIDTAEQRMGGFWPSESLDYLTFGAVPANVTFDSNDAYSYCDGKTPKIIIPLKQIGGFWIPTWNNFGAAVYDGSTGKVSVHTDTSKIPGPVYPMSLATTQREALVASGSFADYFFNRSGFEDTSGDVDDPNGANNSEFRLRFADRDGSAYITPLTPRGDSSSVVALALTDGSTSKPGTRNALTVHRYPKGESRSANSSLEQGIRSTYSFMPDWASGLKVFEIVPTADGDWMASIGQKQTVVYRAVISPTGDAVLYDESGTEVTRTTGASKDSADAEPAPETSAATSDLSKLTPAQLQELASAILAELTSRTGTK